MPAACGPGPERHRQAVSHSEVAGLRVRTRLAQIERRLTELHARSEEMSFPPARRGPGRDRPARAAHHAHQAETHAAEAARLATMAYLRSAQVHDHVADLYDRLLSGGAADVTRCRQQADRHRALAVRDRVAARQPPHDREGLGPGQRADG